MDQFGAGMDLVLIYLDDILIASIDKATHLHHVRSVFSRLQELFLAINLSECHFELKDVEYLGHRISAAGAEPLIRHAAVIQEFSPPSDVPQLQQFHGLIYFDGCFLPIITQPSNHSIPP